MAPDRWTRAHELFDQALQLPPGQRAKFLAHACPDEDLRREVQSLLEHDTAAGEEFLDPSGAPSLSEDLGSADAAPAAPADARAPRTTVGPDPATGTPNDRLIGRRIGRYRVKAVLAPGRLATVYEATQEQPHRVVALKVLNPGVASPSALRRFQFESQLLARLRQPNIAQVYEAGIHVDAGVEIAYFAMEYIPGARPITDYALTRGLPIRARLELFAKVCDAVDHGHQRGIIHRDLKPANILVDAAGEPKVIDFGVARATDSDMAATTQQTFVGQLVGTLQYMSPEQCDGDPHELDTRSDVYSLGVVLYELLTGQPPYDASTTTVYHAVRTIRECEPLPPSQVASNLGAGRAPCSGFAGQGSATGRRRRAPSGRRHPLARALRGDLDTIALKALAKRREDRYASAADLARDIRRHLRGDPIEARPPTAWARAVRWVGRHPSLTTAAACLLIAAATLLATQVAVWHLNQRPDRIVCEGEGRGPWPSFPRVRLLARTGAEIWLWDSDDDQRDAYRFGALADRPRPMGGGQLVLIGGDPALARALPAPLCAYDPRRGFADPVWLRRVIDEEVLDYLRQGRNVRGEEFTVRDGGLVDVFPEDDVPGAEVLVIFGNLRSQRIVRIYDLAGTLLFEFWHDGILARPYWLSGPRLLVFAGRNERESFDEAGNMISDRPNPYVVFAVRPERGAIDRCEHVLLRHPGHTVRPEWCLRLRPEVLAERDREIRLHAPPDAYYPPGQREPRRLPDPARHFVLALTLDPENPHAVAHYIIDNHGTYIGRGEHSDALRRAVLRYEQARRSSWLALWTAWREPGAPSNDGATRPRDARAGSDRIRPGWTGALKGFLRRLLLDPQEQRGGFVHPEDVKFERVYPPAPPPAAPSSQ